MSLPPELIWLVRSRNGRLVATFAGFIAIQFIFAALYYWLYKRSRDNFNFNSDILKNQAAVTRTSTSVLSPHYAQRLERWAIQ